MWVRIPEEPETDALAAQAAPMICLLPGDLWQYPRLRYRIAADGSLTRIAYHVIWDAPSLSQVRKTRPEWSKGRAERAWREILRHEAQWGPGDVEAIYVVVDPAGGLVELRHRLPAKPWQLVWRWIRGQELRKMRTDRNLDRHPKRLGHLGLAVHSQHHEFRRIRRHEEAESLELAPFSEDLWRHHKMRRHRRGFERWETQAFSRHA